jgi:hypothetical protein
MRKLSILAPVAVLTLGAGMTLAASPASSTPGSSSAAGAASTASTTATSWSAKVRPLDAVTGGLTVSRATDGTGVLTLKLDGMRQDAAWSVDVEGGTAARPIETDEIAERSGADVVRTGTDTLTIHLTRAEMDAFVKDQAKSGIVVSISDGSRQAVATLPAG